MIQLAVAMRVRRSIGTFVTEQASTLVILLVALVATPLLLGWLGDERYGAVEAAAEWLGYVGLLEFGIGGALLPLMARAAAQRDQGQVLALVAAGIRAYLFAVALMAAAVVVLIAAIATLLPVSPGLRFDLQAGCAVGGMAVLLLPLSVFRVLLEAEQRGYIVNSALLVQSLSVTAFSLLLAWAKWGITGQFLAVLLGGVIFYAIIVSRQRAAFREMRQALTRRIRESDQWKQIKDLNWPTFVFNLCGRIGLVTDNIIVGGLLSPAMVVPFFLTQQLPVLARRQLQGIGNASWAGLAELHVQGESEVFNQRLIELTRLIAVLAVAALAPIVVFDRKFIGLWVGGARYAGDTLVVIAAINAFLLAIFSLWGWCINGIGQVRMIMPGLVVQTAINFVFSIALTLKVGILGPVLGTTLGFVCVSSWYLPKLLHQCFATSPLDLARAAGWPIVSALPFAVLVWLMARSFPPRGWVDMAAEMSAAALAYLAAWWLVGLSRHEKDLWLQRINVLIPRDSY